MLTAVTHVRLASLLEVVQGDVTDVHLSRCQSTRYIGLLGALPRVCMPLADTEVSISLHSRLGRRRTAMDFEAGDTFDVAATHFASQSTVGSLWKGGTT